MRLQHLHTLTRGMTRIRTCGASSLNLGLPLVNCRDLVIFNFGEQFYLYQKLIFGAVIASTKVLNKISPEREKG